MLFTWMRHYRETEKEKNMQDEKKQCSYNIIVDCML